MIKKFLKVFFFTASLSLVACSGIMSVPNEPKENAAESTVQNTNSAQTTGTTLSGRIIVNGALPSQSPSEQALRTAFPTLPDTLTYQVTAQKGGSTVSGTVSTAGTTTTYTIDFPELGEWTITAKALSGSQLYLITTATIDTNVTLSKNLILKYPSTSTSSDPGSISLPISFADSLGITQISTKLVGVDGATAVTSVSSLTSIGSFKTFTFSRASVAAGQYTLAIGFKDSASGAPLYYLKQTVNVYPGLQTNKFYGDEPYIQDNKIKITDLSSATLTTFYVHSTNGSDTGNGSYFDPVKTLAQAANLVTNSTATPSAGFKIILQTNTTETSNIALTKKTEIITDAGDGTKRTVNGDSHSLTSTADTNFTDINFSQMAGFKVESGTVKMVNGEFSICIGNVVGSSYCGGAVFTASGATFEATDFDFNVCVASDGPGGAIYSEGSVTLTNCNITNCMAGYGGAIYSKGTLNLDNCVLSKNYASNEGGAIHAVGTSTVAANINMDNCTIGVESPTSVASEDKDTCIAAGGNYSEGGGGAVLLGSYAELTATSSKINGNYAGGAGGGINSQDDSSVKFTGGEICFNKANGQGGGLQIYSKLAAGSFVKNAAIKNNSSNADGGGISVTTGKYFKVDSCTEISGNTATGNGNGVYAAGKLTLVGSTYIADGIYLNTEDSPLTLNNDFELSGTNTIPLSYSTTSFDASNSTKNTLIKGSSNTSLTSTQCDAFTLTDSSGTAITDYIIKYISSSSLCVGKLAPASSGSTAFEVGTGKTYPTLEDALTAIAISHSTSPADEYQIKVFNDLTLTSDLEISTPGVKITSDDDTTHRSISGGGTPTYGVKVTAAGVQFDKVDFTALLGGINVASGDLTLNNSKVGNGKEIKNSSENYASGITVKTGATLKSDEGLIIDSCDNNTTSGHSGIFNDGGAVDLTGATIKKCNNTASGGGIYTIASSSASNTMRLKNCIITENEATAGGGIYCYGTEITIEGGEISKNQATYGNGGGVYVTSRYSVAADTYFLGKFIMQDDSLILKDNETNESQQGGGIYVFSGTVKLNLDSATKDTGNLASSIATTQSGNLCYIRASDDDECPTTILAGSRINDSPWSSDTILNSNVWKN